MFHRPSRKNKDGDLAASSSVNPSALTEYIQKVNNCIQRLYKDKKNKKDEGINRSTTKLIEVLGVTSDNRLVTVAMSPAWAIALPIVLKHDDCLPAKVFFDTRHEPAIYIAPNTQTSASGLEQERVQILRWNDQDFSKFDEEFMRARPMSDRTSHVAPRLYDSGISVALPIRTKDRRIVGVIVMEARDITDFKDSALPIPPETARLNDTGIRAISPDMFAKSSMGSILKDLAEVLDSPPSTSIHDHLASFDGWMHAIEERVAKAQHPNRHRSFYDQVLQVARRIPKCDGVGAVLMLLRKVNETYIDPQYIEDTLDLQPTKRDCQDDRFNKSVVVIHKVNENIAPTEPQWDLLGYDGDSEENGYYNSLASYVMCTKTPTLLADVSAPTLPSIKIKPAGPEYQHGTEMQAYLDSGDRINRVIGTIALLHQEKHAFKDDGPESDLNRLQRFCDIVARAVWRNSQVGKYRHGSHQSRFSRGLFRLLNNKLQDINLLNSVNTLAFTTLRDRFRHLILAKALSECGADNGVLAQVIDNGETFNFVTSSNYTRATKSMPTSTGIMGFHYREVKRSGIINRIEEFSETGYNYEKFFENTSSELVALAPKGANPVFVLNLESDRPDYFTSNHLMWCEFLVEMAITSESLIQSTYRNLLQQQSRQLSVRTNEIVRKVADMRHYDVLHLDSAYYGDFFRPLLEAGPYHALCERVEKQGPQHINYLQNKHILQLQAIQFARETLLNQLITEFEQIMYDVEITIYRAIRQEPRTLTEQKDQHANVQFVEIAPARDEHRSSIAATDILEDPLDDTFLRRKGKPLGLIHPVFEGGQCIGLVQMYVKADYFSEEDTREYYYPRLMELKNLVLNVLTTYDLRLSELQMEILREFEKDIARGRDSEQELASRILRGAHAVTTIDSGWGIIMMRSYTGGFLTYYLQFEGIATPHTTLATSGPKIERLRETQLVQRTEKFNPDLEYQAYFLPDQQEIQKWIDQKILPSGNAASLLCLTQHEVSPASMPEQQRGTPGQPQCTVLIASEKPYHISERDGRVLALFLQSASIGLKNIEIQQSRVNLTRMLRDEVSQFHRYADRSRKMGEIVGIMQLNSPTPSYSTTTNFMNALVDLREIQKENDLDFMMTSAILNWSMALMDARSFIVPYDESEPIGEHELVPFEIANGLSSFLTDNHSNETPHFHTEQVLINHARQRNAELRILPIDVGMVTILVPQDTIMYLRDMVQSLLFGLIEVAIQYADKKAAMTLYRRSITLKGWPQEKHFTIEVGFYTGDPDYRAPLLEQINDLAGRTGCTFSQLKQPNSSDTEYCSLSLSFPLKGVSS